MSSFALRRRLRITTLASSPLARTILTYSLRRSSVSSGMVTRMMLPSLLGLAPRFGKLTIARSISLSAVLSYGVMISVRASGFCRLASCCSGVGVP